MAYRHRALEARLKKYLGLFPAIAVTGPQQSGKSTLFQTAYPDLPYVILDEAQRATELLSYLKIAIDADFERQEMPKGGRKNQMLLGSYPEVTMRDHEGAREWYASYLATYLERDVRVANDVGKLSGFQTLIRLLAVRTSQECNATRSELSRLQAPTMVGWQSRFTMVAYLAWPAAAA